MVGTAASFFHPAHAALLKASEFLIAGHISVHVISGATYIHGLLLVPDGRLASKLQAWLLLPLYAVAAAVILASFFYASTLNFATVGPKHISVITFLERVNFTVLFGLLIPVVGIASQVYRYRRETSFRERQRAKFILWGLGLVLGGGLLVVLTGTAIYIAQVGGTSGDLLGYLNRLIYFYSPPFFALVPVVLSVAIVRYHLFDMDLVIRRTLVYTTLTGILAGLYIACIGAAQRLILVTTGQRSDAAIAMATFLVATLFTPIKNSLQTLVDTRFREPADPAKKLLAFRDQVRAVLQVTDSEALSTRLLQEATSAFGATKGAIYLRDQGRPVLARVVGDWDDHPGLTVPITCNGQELGTLCLGPRQNGHVYTDRDQDVLKAVADEVAVIIQRL
jgi:hypothetical protein